MHTIYSKEKNHTFHLQKPHVHLNFTHTYCNTHCWLYLKWIFITITEFLTCVVQCSSQASCGLGVPRCRAESRSWPSPNCPWLTPWRLQTQRGAPCSASPTCRAWTGTNFVGGPRRGPSRQPYPPKAFWRALVSLKPSFALS